MTHWTGIDAWRSWRGTERDLGPVTSFANNGKVFIWWLAKGDTTGRLLNISGGVTQGDLLPPKCGGGRSGVSLDFVDGRRHERTGRVGKGGTTPHRIFICGRWSGCIYGHGMVAGSVCHPDWVVQQGGALKKSWEDGWDDLPPLPRGRDPFRSSLQAVDD